MSGPTRASRTIALAMLCTAALLAQASAVAAESNARTVFHPVGTPPSATITGYELAGPEPTRYYILGPETTQATRMIVFVPGSGCDGAFPMRKDGKMIAGNEVFARHFADKAKLVVLEAPGVLRQFVPPFHGLSEGCPASFLARSDLDHLIASYKQAVDDALAHASPKIDAIMFLGVSDGALTAATLARAYPQTTHLTLISGFGSGQVAGQMEERIGAVLDAPNDKDAGSELATYAAKLESLQAHPASTETWHGQSEAHWASTIHRSPVAEVLALPPRVQMFLAQGGDDGDWPVTNFRHGLADLLTAGRRPWIQYIPCGNHSLSCPDDRGQPRNLGDAVESATRWFVEGAPGETWVHLPGGR